MKTLITYLITVLFSIELIGQNSTLIKAGDTAPPFVLNLEQNTIQGIKMPYLNKIVLLHFWSTTQASAKKNNRYLNQLVSRYKDSEYINAEGFEVMSVAVQSDKTAWKEAIRNDSLNQFIHAIASKGFSEDVCVKFGVTTLPTDILIDENGIVIAINPKLIDIENTLDTKKNIHPLKRDIHGLLAQSSDKKDISKYVKVYLFNHYEDSLAFTRTNAKGEFVFNDIKLNQDFILKVDNQINIITSDPIALYTKQGEHVLDGKTGSGGFVFYVPSKLSTRLIEEDSNAVKGHSNLEITITKSLEFKNNGQFLSVKDEQELSSVLQILQKNKTFMVEYSTHTDSKIEPKAAQQLTDKQAAAVLNFLQKKGIPLSRIRFFSKGNSEPRKACQSPPGCTEEEHKLNRRVEFTFFHN